MKIPESQIHYFILISLKLEDPEIVTFIGKNKGKRMA